MIFGGSVGREINPDMIGLFFEDINFAADGGLYAEMLENRNFEAIRSRGEQHNYLFQPDNLYAWGVLEPESVLMLNMNSPVHEANPHYVRFGTTVADGGFANKAYDGVFLKAGMNYKVSFYAREVRLPKCDLRAAITKDGVTMAEVRIPFEPSMDYEPTKMEKLLGQVVPKRWIRYEAEFVADQDVKGGIFELHLGEPGTMEFDLFSLMPGDAVEGIFRKDLFDALAGLHPGFIRFPGGCIVEGTSLMRRYRWKDTVGPLPARRTNTNLWGLPDGNMEIGWETENSHYMQTYGIGFYEYFRLCELLSTADRVCKPLPVLGIGVACQFRSYETVEIGSLEFDEYVQDALDLIEFANGPVDSKWGGLRARMGHPEPFGLDMIAIGNEQWQSPIVDLKERYALFEEAIHKVYPEMRLLGTAGPNVNTPLYEEAWKPYYEKIEENPSYVYAVDEHYYVKPEWLYENVDFYDEYPRSVGVFAGEYAGHDANQSNSVVAALAEAAMLTGMERNGDVVKLASYAPLFNRIGHTQWTPDMIWFDEEQVILTPSYYVQKLFSDYAGSVAVDLQGQEKELRKKHLFVSLVLRGEKRILKVVNASEEKQILPLVTASGQPVCGQAELVRFGAKNGKAMVPVRSAAVGDDPHNASIAGGRFTNLEMCMMRGVEEASYVVEQCQIRGQVELAPQSVTVVML